jgi:hypothetical protein
MGLLHIPAELSAFCIRPRGVQASSPILNGGNLSAKARQVSREDTMKDRGSIWRARPIGQKQWPLIKYFLALIGFNHL